MAEAYTLQLDAMSMFGAEQLVLRGQQQQLTLMRKQIKQVAAGLQAKAKQPV